MLPRAEQPFRFYTQAELTLVTGLRARSLRELANQIKVVPESVIYRHTHRFLYQHQYLIPEPPNDFAYWITNVLQDENLGEQIAAINTIQFNTIEELRQAILQRIENNLKTESNSRQVAEDKAFNFMRLIRFCLPTDIQVVDLQEFADGLTKVTLSSLYFHIYEARLRPPKGINDFSWWFTNSLHENKLARQLADLDPYTQTMDGLRQRILNLVRARIKELERAAA